MCKSKNSVQPKADVALNSAPKLVEAIEDSKPLTNLLYNISVPCVMLVDTVANLESYQLAKARVTDAMHLEIILEDSFPLTVEEKTFMKNLHNAIQDILDCVYRESSPQKTV